MTDILERLVDLHEQATQEKSHYYVASCCRDAMAEIFSLRCAIRRLYRAQYRNGTHGDPPMVSVDAATWNKVGGQFQAEINAP